MSDVGAYRFLKSEVLELSLVTIPANASATIATIKSLDEAALGRRSPAPALRAFPLSARHEARSP